MASSRVLSLYLPTWSTDLARRRLRATSLVEGRRVAERGTPSRRGASPDPGSRTGAVVLVREERARSLVAGRCAVAAAMGVAVGMGLAEARALLGGRPFTATPL